MKQEVYYIHKESGTIISRTEVARLIKEEDRHYFSFVFLKELELSLAWKEDQIDKPIESQKVTVDLYTIHINDAWETVVVDKTTLTLPEIFNILNVLDVSKGCLHPRVRNKIVAKFEILEERRSKNVKIPEYE